MGIKYRLTLPNNAGVLESEDLTYIQGERDFQGGHIEEVDMQFYVLNDPTPQFFSVESDAQTRVQELISPYMVAMTETLTDPQPEGLND